MKQEKFILSVLVMNQSGVLTRVASLFSRRGFNIDSLTVGETQDPTYSKMTITSTGDEYIKDQMVKQLAKLHEVKKIELLPNDSTLARELLLVKVVASNDKRPEIMEAVHVFRAKAIDFTQETISVEITGETSKLDAFLDYLKPYGVLDVCRTGITAMSRGEVKVSYCAAQ